MKSVSEKKVAIVQSSYVPWRGYFDLIARVDEFVLFDDVQYTRRDWRNRNRIKTPSGVQWLTIPVEVKGRYLQKIKETRIAAPTWARDHWRMIVGSYTRAPRFAAYKDALEELYTGATDPSLSMTNRRFIEGICQLLAIPTRITWSMDYEVPDGKTERLVSICEQAGATEYVSGPSARAYIEPALFAARGIRLTWMDYSGYREYPQLHPPFDAHLSVLDVILNAGKEGFHETTRAVPAPAVEAEA